jgi:7-cyano-7-deazaguanine synthase in queuosine biosynthesis
MTAAGHYRFLYATDRSDIPPKADGRTILSRSDLHASDLRLRKITSPASPNDQWAHDLWDVVIGCHLADRVARRDPADDHWTRHIDIVLPVGDLDRWTESVVDTLANVLEVSTGDRWTLHLRQRRRSTPYAEPELGEIVEAPHAEQVALYSGGLDSTAYAAQVARSRTDTVFVTYTRARLRPIQDAVFAAVEALGDPKRLRRVDPISMQPRRTPRTAFPPSKLDMTSRSRGLLFTTTAVYVAAAYDTTTVVVPENGQLAINPPLSKSRMSSCSTRSAHPWVVHQLNGLIKELGGHVKVINPLLQQTKGDVCRAALKAGLTEETLFATISCGKPPFFRNTTRAEHCGLCVACLLRRSGLHSAIGYDDTEYEEPVPTLAPASLVADIAALARWSAEPFTPLDLLADLPIPPDAGLRPLMTVLGRVLEPCRVGRATPG